MSLRIFFRIRCRSRRLAAIARLDTSLVGEARHRRPESEGGRAMGTFLESLRKAIDRNIAGLFALAAAAGVLLFVPQIADIWWKLPYRVAGSETFPALGFRVFVVFIALGYFACWLTLARFTDEIVPAG